MAPSGPNMNIIIPMGGIGNRFRSDGYRFPKPLVNVLGRAMLYWLLDHLSLVDGDVVYYAIDCVIEHDFQLYDRLKKEYPNVELVCVPLNFQTRGAAETLSVVLSGIPPERRSLKTICLDCDTIYFEDILSKFRAMDQSLNATFYFKDEQDRPLFSYIKMDSGGRVQEVKEKTPVSRHANTGAYAFRDAATIMRYAETVLDGAVGAAGEYYTSTVIQRMLDDGQCFLGIGPVKDFHCLGTPAQVDEFLELARQGKVQVKRTLKFCFDLDNTLVTAPAVSGDYSTVSPKPDNVQLVRQLKECGHYIIISTARRMRTHKGNIGKILQDVGLVTMMTLSDFGIPYDELHFGKPHADIYVDDLAVNALVDTRKEIGWWKPEEEVKDRTSMIAARGHNHVVALDDRVVKSSSHPSIRGEAHFYQSTPPGLSHLFAHLHSVTVEDGLVSICMERVNGATLSHLAVNGCLTPGRLLRVLEGLHAMHTYRGGAPADAALADRMYDNYAPKVRARFTASREVYAELEGSDAVCNALVAKLEEFRKSLLGYDYILLDRWPLRGQDRESARRLMAVYGAFVAERYPTVKMADVRLVAASLLFTLIPLHEVPSKRELYFELMRTELADVFT
ncbi:unnamed protein product [Pedinophyceae sp. YPF-701]|nr:unnamed protein product [Pedinophyceae sp. YPF-701]